MGLVMQFLAEETGAEITEWALLVVVLALALLLGAPALKSGLSGGLQSIGNKVNNSGANMPTAS